MRPTSSTSSKQVACAKALELTSNVPDAANIKDRLIADDNYNEHFDINRTGVGKRRSLNDVELIQSNQMIENSLKPDMRYVYIELVDSTFIAHWKCKQKSHTTKNKAPINCLSGQLFTVIILST